MTRPDLFAARIMRDSPTAVAGFLAKDRLLLSRKASGNNLVGQAAFLENRD